MAEIIVQLNARKDNVLSLRYPGGHEVVSVAEEIQHPIVRQALQKFGINTGMDLLLSSDPSLIEDFSTHLAEALKK